MPFILSVHFWGPERWTVLVPGESGCLMEQPGSPSGPHLPSPQASRSLSALTGGGDWSGHSLVLKFLLLKPIC